MAEIKEYNEYIRDFIEDKIHNYSGSTTYGCDLGNLLTESINVDGSATYNTHLAKQYIKEWWDEAAEVYEYQKMNYGECLHNPFEEPEKFHVCMVIEGVNSILSQCDVIDDNWNEEFELTEEIIDEIIADVKEKEVQF